jgi:Mg-chelatase subunit ChlD
MTTPIKNIFLTSLLTFVALLPIGVAKAKDMEAAIDLVEAFIDAQDTALSNGDGPLLDSAYAAAPYVVDTLAVDGLQGQLGFDPIFNAQDNEVSNVQVFADPDIPFLRGAAQVRVQLTNFGQPQEFVYSLIPVPPHNEWQISDIYSQTSDWSLHNMAADLGVNMAAASSETEITLTRGENGPLPGMEQRNLAGDGLDSPGNDLLFLLDGSGSMWGQIDGVAKITTARQALSAILNDLKPSTNVGLMAYGHRREGDCSDIEVFYPVANYDAGQLSAAVNGITPRGKTPIADSLLQAAQAMPVSDRRADILLISDGLETCGGDPCAVTARLAEQGINTRVHVVGFDLSEEEHTALQCIADNSNGQYFRANDAQSFANAINQAVAQTQAAPPAPVEPTPPTIAEVYFEEPFDGPELHEDWQIDNPIKELANFTEDGALFVAAIGDEPYFSKPEAPNRLTLNQDLPQGDFDLVLEFRQDVQTQYENVWLSVYEAPHEQIGAMLYVWPKGCGRNLHLTLIRRTGSADDAEETRFDRNLFDGPIVDGTCSTNKAGREKADAVLDALASDGATLRLKRRGRQVTGEVTLTIPGDAEPFVFESEPITALRLSGKPSILGGHWHKAQPGESHFSFDRFAIEEPVE